MEPLRIQLSTPIQSVAVTNDRPTDKSRASTGQNDALAQQTKKAASLCAALQSAVSQVEQLSKDIFVSHREQIVRLSVEIAARILARDVHQRNYDIESIVMQALQHLGAAQRLTIRLHPDDLAVWQNAAKEQSLPALENILCIGDPSLQKAECVVETDQGVIEYLIEEQLKQVTAALLGAEAPMETVS